MLTPQTFTLQLLLLTAAAAYKSVVPYLPGETLILQREASGATSTPAAETAEPISSSAQPPTPQPPVKEEYFPAVAPPQAAQSESTSLLPPMPVAMVDDATRRRVITYDQRQEGQYNIRADLENFMIVLIPPGPQEGLNLLDLLTKSSLRGSSKGKRKHYATRAALKAAGGPSPPKSFYQRQPQQQQAPLSAARGYQSQQLAILGDHGTGNGDFADDHARLGLPDFIEGRTPYHVDISASDDEQARLHPERQQVDVLPPPYFPQLIKPFHLDAEPTLIQALPLAEVAATTANSVGSASNLLESYNQAGSQYYRNARALRGDSYLDTNRLAATDVGSIFNPRAISAPIYRADLNGHSNANALYPPIDAPAYFLGDAQARSWRLDDEPTSVQQPKHELETDVLTFDLLGDALADSKTLLRDGLARCAPGQRRDSYGVCRQIEGY